MQEGPCPIGSGDTMIGRSTFVRVVRVNVSREVLAMSVHRVVQGFRAWWRDLYSFSIWSNGATS
jgi:hypothetical protein